MRPLLRASSPPTSPAGLRSVVRGTEICSLESGRSHQAVWGREYALAVATDATGSNPAKPVHSAYWNGLARADIRLSIEDSPSAY